MLLAKSRANLAMFNLSLSGMLLVACSSSSTTNSRSGLGINSGSATGAVTSGSLSSGGLISGTGGTTLAHNSGGNADAVLGDACAKDTYEAEQRPLTIYTLFDDSGSMWPWWIPVTQAFIDFSYDPSSEGINVGVKFFGSECSADFYSNPDIPIGALTSHGMAIEANLGVHIPISGTATTPALQGGLLAAQQRSSMFPDEKVVILLVTDGLPSDCGSDLTNATAAAQAAADAGFPVYVLGLGDINGLNSLAQAGGTGQALSADPTMVDLVVAAMNEIRGLALPCDYAIPAGGENMKGYINLVYDDGAGNTGTILNVPDASSCDPTTGGWYFDQAGTRIVACDQSCTSFKSSGSAFEVSVVLGCPTETLF